MFLYLLNDKEGKAFIELAIQAMNIKGDNNTYCDKAEYEGFLTELNLPDYQAVGLSLEDATAELTVGTYKYFKDIEKDNLNPDSLL